jgi:hypothetical protein
LGPSFQVIKPSGVDAMISEGRLMIEEDLLPMPDDGQRYELIGGELRQMALTGLQIRTSSA